MARLSSHDKYVVVPCSYYPLFPPPPGALLDTSLGAQALTMGVTPDVLIVPSDLAAFAKMLPMPKSSHLLAANSPAMAGAAGAKPEFEAAPAAASPSISLPAAGSNAAGTVAVVAINPGRLAKGVTGGSWAQFSIAVDPAAGAALRGDPPETNAAAPHSISSRCRVDIMRI